MTPQNNAHNKSTKATKHATRHTINRASHFALKRQLGIIKLKKSLHIIPTPTPATTHSSSRQLLQRSQCRHFGAFQYDENPVGIQSVGGARNRPQDLNHFLDTAVGTIRQAQFQSDETNAMRSQYNFDPSNSHRMHTHGYSDIMGAERLRKEQKLELGDDNKLVLDTKFQHFMPDTDHTAPDVVRLSTKSDFNLDFELEIEWQKVNNRQQLKEGSYMSKHQQSEFRTVFDKMVEAKQREFKQERTHLEAIRQKKLHQKIQKIRLVKLHRENMDKIPEEIELEQVMNDFITIDRDLDPLESFRREQEISEKISKINQTKRQKIVDLAKMYGLTPGDLDIGPDGTVNPLYDINDDIPEVEEVLGNTREEDPATSSAATTQPPHQPKLQLKSVQPSPFGFDPRNANNQLTPGHIALALYDSTTSGSAKMDPNATPNIDEADIIEHYYGYGDIISELYDADMLTSTSHSILQKLEHAMDPDFETKAEQLVKDIATDHKIPTADLSIRQMAQDIKIYKESLIHKTKSLVANEYGELQVYKMSPDQHLKLQQQRENTFVGGKIPSSVVEVQGSPTMPPNQPSYIPKDHISSYEDAPSKQGAALVRKVQFSQADLADLEFNQTKLTETGRNDRFDNFNDDDDMVDMKKMLFRKHNEELKHKWASEEKQRDENLFSQQEKELEHQRQTVAWAAAQQDGFKPMMVGFNQFQTVNKNEILATADPFADKKKRHGDITLSPRLQQIKSNQLPAQDTTLSPPDSLNPNKRLDLDAEMMAYERDEKGEGYKNENLIKGLKYNGVDEDAVIYHAQHGGYKSSGSAMALDNVVYTHLLDEDETKADDLMTYYEKDRQKAETNAKKHSKRNQSVLDQVDSKSILTQGGSSPPSSSVTSSSVIGKGASILGEGDLTEPNSDDDQNRYMNEESPTLETIGLAMAKQEQYRLKKVKKTNILEDFGKSQDAIDIELDHMKAQAAQRETPYESTVELDQALKSYFTSPAADPTSTQGYQLGQKSPLEDFDFFQTAPRVSESLLDNALDPGAGQDPLQFDDDGKNILKSTSTFRKMQDEFKKIARRREDAANKRRILESQTFDGDHDTNKNVYEELKDGLDEEDKKFFNPETGEVYYSRGAKTDYSSANKFIDEDHLEDANMMDAAGEDYINEMFSRGKAQGGIGVGDKASQNDEQAELHERLEDLSQKMKRAAQDSKDKAHLQQGGVKMHPTDYLGKFMLRIHPDMFAEDKYRVVDDKMIINIKRNIDRNSRDGETLLQSSLSKSDKNASLREYETGEYQNPNNIRYYELTGEFLQAHNSKMLSDFNTLVDFYKKLAELPDRERADPFMSHLQPNLVPPSQSFVFFLRSGSNNQVNKPKNVKLMKPIWDNDGNEVRFDRNGRVKRNKSPNEKNIEQKQEDDGVQEDDDDMTQFLAPETMHLDEKGNPIPIKNKKKKAQGGDPVDYLDPSGRTIEDFVINEELDEKDKGDYGDDLPHLRAVRVWFSPPPKLSHGSDPRDQTTAWMLQLERTMVEVLSGLGEKDVPTSILERWKTELTATYVGKQWTKLVKKKESYLDKIFKTNMTDLVTPSNEQVLDLVKDSSMAYYHMFPYATRQREADFRAKTHPRHHLFNALMVGGYISFDPTIEPKQRIKSLHDLNRLVTVNYQHLDCFRWWNKSISQNDILEQAKIEEYIQQGNQALKKKGKLDPYEEELMNTFPYHDEERQNVWPSAETGENLSIRFAVHYLPHGSKPTALLVSSRKLMLEMHGTQGTRAAVLKDILNVGADMKARRTKALKRERQAIEGEFHDENGPRYEEKEEDFEAKTNRVFELLQQKHRAEQDSIANVKKLIKYRDRVAKKLGMGQGEKLSRSVQLKRKIQLMKLNSMNDGFNGDSEETDTEYDHGDNDTDDDGEGMGYLERRRRRQRESIIQKNYVHEIAGDIYGANNRQNLLKALVGPGGDHDEENKGSIDERSPKDDEADMDYVGGNDYIFDISPDKVEMLHDLKSQEDHQRRLKRQERLYAPPTTMNDVCLQIRIPYGMHELDLQKHLMTHAYILYDEWKLHFTDYHVELNTITEKKTLLEAQYTKTGKPPTDPLFKQHIFTIAELTNFLLSDLASKEKQIVNPKKPSEIKKIKYSEIVLNRIRTDQPSLYILSKFYNTMADIEYQRHDEDNNPERTAAKQQQKMDDLKKLMKEQSQLVDPDTIKVDPNSLNMKTLPEGGVIDRIQRDLAFGTMKKLLKEQGKGLDEKDVEHLIGKRKKPSSPAPNQDDLKITFIPSPHLSAERPMNTTMGPQSAINSQNLNALPLQESPPLQSTPTPRPKHHRAMFTPLPTEAQHPSTILPSTMSHLPHFSAISHRLRAHAKKIHHEYQGKHNEHSPRQNLPLAGFEEATQSSKPKKKDHFGDLEFQLAAVGINPTDESALHKFADEEMESWEMFSRSLKTHPEILPVYSELKRVVKARKDITLEIVQLNTANPDGKMSSKDTDELIVLEREYLELKAIVRTHQDHLEFIRKRLCKQHFPRVHSFLYQEEAIGEGSDDDNDADNDDYVHLEDDGIHGGELQLINDENYNPAIIYGPNGTLVVQPGAHLTGPELVALDHKRKSTIPRHQQTSLTEHFTIKDRMSNNAHMYNRSSEYTSIRDKTSPLGTYEERVMQVSQQRGEINEQSMARAKTIIEHGHTTRQRPNIPPSPILPQQQKGQPPVNQFTQVSSPQATILQQNLKPKDRFNFKATFKQHFAELNREHIEKQRNVITQQKRVEQDRIDKGRALKEKQLAQHQAQMDMISEAQQKKLAAAKTPHDRVEFMIEAHNSGVSPIPKETSVQRNANLKRQMIQINLQAAKNESLNDTSASYALSLSHKIQSQRDKESDEVASSYPPTTSLKRTKTPPPPRLTRRERRQEMNNKLDQQAAQRSESVNAKMSRSILEAKSKKESELAIHSAKAIQLATQALEKKRVARENIRMAILHDAGIVSNSNTPSVSSQKVGRGGIFQKIPMDIQLTELNNNFHTVVNLKEMLPSNFNGASTVGSHGYFGNIYGATDDKRKIARGYDKYVNWQRADRVQRAAEAPIKERRATGPQLVAL